MAGTGGRGEEAPMNHHENPVISRKVRGPKMQLAGFPPLEPLCAAFATISATKIRRALDAPVEISVIGYEAVRHGAFLQKLLAPTSIYLLRFPSSGGLGLVRAHPGLLNRVLDYSLANADPDDAPDADRPLTPIDISIYGRFVDLVTSAFHDAVVEICGRDSMGRAELSSFEASPGMVRIAPNRSELFAIKLGVRIGDQTDFAGLDFVLPLATLASLKPDLAETATTDASVLEAWERSMLMQVLGLPLETDCVIDLGAFSVGELSRLKQGALLELPPDALGAVELRVPTAGGEVAFARGRLGAKGRHKAIRLVEDPNEAFLEPMRRVTDRPALEEDA